jgi:hypothetical protein
VEDKAPCGRSGIRRSGRPSPKKSQPGSPKGNPRTLARTYTRTRTRTHTWCSHAHTLSLSLHVHTHPFVHTYADCLPYRRARTACARAMDHRPGAVASSVGMSVWDARGTLRLPPACGAGSSSRRAYLHALSRASTLPESARAARYRSSLGRGARSSVCAFIYAYYLPVRASCSAAVRWVPHFRARTLSRDARGAIRS